MSWRHGLIHVGVAGAAVVVLPLLFDVAWPTALLIGLMAGCAAMMLGIGHGTHRHGTTRSHPAAPTGTDTARTDTDPRREQR